MEKTKHTPGPWEIGALFGDPDGKSYEYPTIYRRNEDGSTTYVADIMGALSPPAWPNAHLIAAAPDLLEACGVLLKAAPELWGEDVEKWPRLMDRVEAAIAKAEGRE